MNAYREPIKSNSAHRDKTPRQGTSLRASTTTQSKHSWTCPTKRRPLFASSWQARSDTTGPGAPRLTVGERPHLRNQSAKRHDAVRQECRTRSEGVQRVLKRLHTATLLGGVLQERRRGPTLVEKANCVAAFVDRLSKQGTTLRLSMSAVDCHRVQADTEHKKTCPFTVLLSPQCCTRSQTPELFYAQSKR